MFDAYSVAIKLTLINEASRGLMLISGQMQKFGKDVDLVQAKLKRMKETMLFGAGVAGAGFLGLGIINHALKPAAEYTKQLNIMNMAGMKQVEIAEATSAAWKATGQILNTTATQNLKTILDLRNVFGSTKEAIEYLPEMARISAVLKSSSESGVRDNAQNLAFGLAKALDVRGVTTNPAMFNAQAEAMAKVITATQGRILPEDYRMLFKYARQSTYGLSNEFLYQELPTFMMEMKGKSGSGSHGGFGSSLAAGYRFFVQGIMNQRAAQGLSNLGLIPKGSILKTTTTGTTLKGGVKGAELFQSDPYAWTQQVLLPAIEKKYGSNLSKEKLTMIINQLMKGNQLAQFEILQFALKAQQVERDKRIIQQAKGSVAASRMAFSSDPFTAMSALGAQWENLKTAFGMSVIPVILPAIINLSKGLNDLAETFRKHQELAKSLAVAFGGLFAAMAIGGTVIALTGAFAALATPLGAVVLGIVALGVALKDIVRLIAAIKNFDIHRVAVTSSGVDYGHHHVVGGWLGEAISAIHRRFGNDIHVQTHVNLDGRHLTKVVSKHQAKAATTPTGANVFNSNMSLIPTNYSSS